MKNSIARTVGNIENSRLKMPESCGTCLSYSEVDGLYPTIEMAGISPTCF